MKTEQAGKSPKVLVIDIGGTNVKLLATGQKEPRKYPSGPTLTPRKMVSVVKKATADWKYDCISLGYPGPIINGHPLREPHNLGKGWVGFNFTKAFGCPVKVINDAAMQALGSYKGRRMLFLGLGTGLGSAMIVDGVLQPMELAHLAYKNGKSYEDYLGLRGLERMGKKKWRRCVAKVTESLKDALDADYVVLGGGNSKKLKDLPPGAQLGSNETCFSWADFASGKRIMQGILFARDGCNDRVQGKPTSDRFCASVKLAAVRLSASGSLRAQRRTYIRS